MNIDYYEHITPYIKGQLNDEKRKAFEFEMKRDPDLKKAVENYPILMEFLEVAVEEEARSHWSKIQSNGTHKNGEERRSIGAKIVHLITPKRAVMAAVILVLITAYPMWYQFYKQTPEQLYASYFETYPHLESPIRGSEVQSDIEIMRAAAYNAYDSGDFSLAVELFNKIPSGYEEELDDAFYLGISYLETEQTEEATNEFAKIAESSSDYSNDALWLLGLSYLKANECTRAKEIFTSIHDTGLYKAQESGNILKRLKCK